MTDLNAAHKFCTNNKALIEKSETCGCFYCEEIFPGTAVKEYISYKGGETALCPGCNIDSVIPSASGIKITREFLKAMYQRWFTTTVEI